MKFGYTIIYVPDVKSTMAFLKGPLVFKHDSWTKAAAMESWKQGRQPLPLS
jgi:hypothetical protein